MLFQKKHLLPVVAAAVAIFFTTTACHKNSGTGNIEPDRNYEIGGWAGTENSAMIQDDILLFGNGNLPGKVDLSNFLPPIGDQLAYGTCVTWALGYHGKTGMNAQTGNFTPGQLADPANQASPKDLFFAIPAAQKGQNCGGTQLAFAYDIMLQRGVADLQTVPYESIGDCSLTPAPQWDQAAAGNKIKNYREIPVTEDAVKEKLAAGNFVGIGAMVGSDFQHYQGGVLIRNDHQSGGHAMLVVGYDDSKGAFKIANSWGPDWGENGFVWVQYGLFTGNFCHNAFVAYNATNPAPDPTPSPAPAGDADVRADVFSDEQDWDSWDARDRSVIYDVHNTSNIKLPASKQWDVVYLYYNAFDANDFDVVLHQRLTDEFGAGNGPYASGLGYSGNWWHNADVEPQSPLSLALFGSGNGIQWDYQMPPITGSYYLVLIADAFNALGESDEQDNFFYVTDPWGNPIDFEDGEGLTGGKTGEDRDSKIDHHTAVNGKNRNAYTTAEISTFIRHMKETGALKRKVEHFDLKNAPKGH